MLHLEKKESEKLIIKLKNLMIEELPKQLHSIGDIPTKLIHDMICMAKPNASMFLRTAATVIIREHCSNILRRTLKYKTTTKAIQ